MNTRVLVVLAMILVIVVGASVTFWMAAQPEGTAVPAARVLPDVEQRNHRERFFGGDPERDVRGGQEMKPRW